MPVDDLTFRRIGVSEVFQLAAGGVPAGDWAALARASAQRLPEDPAAGPTPATLAISTLLKAGESVFQAL